MRKQQPAENFSKYDKLTVASSEIIDASNVNILIRGLLKWFDNFSLSN